MSYKAILAVNETDTCICYNKDDMDFSLFEMMACPEVKGKIQIRLRILQAKADGIYSRWIMSITWHALPSTQQPVRL